MPAPNTNLAAEFHALSCLHRMGIDAYLTLGNKKACDIVAIRKDRTSISVEVKAVAGLHDWRAGNLVTESPGSHFVVLVSYMGQISDTSKPPAVWVLPYSDVVPMIRDYKGTKNVSRAAVIASENKYLDAWNLIAGTEAHPAVNTAATR
jgi:hypothetical protein